MRVGRQETRELFRTYQRTGARRDRDAVIERFLPLAHSLARRARRGTEPLEDLEQVACLALVKAVDAFDASREIAFTSYAVPCITGALKRHFRDRGWSVRVPRQLQELALRVERVHEELFTAAGTPPTPAQIAVLAGVEVEDVLEARAAYRALHADSLDQPRSSREGDDLGSLLDTLGDRDIEIRRAFDRVMLEALLETLEQRERLIMRLYYQDELTQAEIGRRLGYSQMHISRLLHKATEQLKLAAAQDADATQLTAA